ncbi:MAG: histidine phosphatase family protein [Actinomycetota bacterium]
MKIRIVVETHSTTDDNERGIATGWLPGLLSERGRREAAELGERRRADGLTAVFVSDLGRAVQTVEIAFGDGPTPVFHDWRLRECNYGRLNGGPSPEVHGNRASYLDRPYPGGESWRQAVSRVGRVFEDFRQVPPGDRVLVVGHRATLVACAHFLGGVPLEEALVSDGEWQPGWEYELD